MLLLLQHRENCGGGCCSAAMSGLNKASPGDKRVGKCPWTGQTGQGVKQGTRVVHSIMLTFRIAVFVPAVM